MTILDSWVWPLSGGILLGSVFFCGLWYTVIHGVKSSHPEIWFLVSFVVRMAWATGGFLVVSGGHWERLLACLGGFLLARGVVSCWLPLASVATPASTPEGNHAS